MLYRKKRFSDFKNDDGSMMFDFSKTLIVDDQYLAIFDKDHLIMSKKFLKFTDIAPSVPKEKMDNWSTY